MLLNKSGRALDGTTKTETRGISLSAAAESRKKRAAPTGGMTMASYTSATRLGLVAFALAACLFGNAAGAAEQKESAAGQGDLHRREAVHLLSRPGKRPLQGHAARQDIPPESEERDRAPGVCEACHGPGSLHAKNSKDKSLIIGFTKGWNTPIETQNG